MTIVVKMIQNAGSIAGKKKQKKSKLLSLWVNHWIINLTDLFKNAYSFTAHFHTI